MPGRDSNPGLQIQSQLCLPFRGGPKAEHSAEGRSFSKFGPPLFHHYGSASPVHDDEEGDVTDMEAKGGASNAIRDWSLGVLEPTGRRHVSSNSSSDSTTGGGIGGSGCNEANVGLNEIFEGSNLLKNGKWCTFSGEAVRGFKSDNSWDIEDATDAAVGGPLPPLEFSKLFDELAKDGKMGMGKWRPPTEVRGSIPVGGCWLAGLGEGDKYLVEGGGEVIEPRLNGLEQEVGIGLTMGGLLFSSFCSSLILRPSFPAAWVAAFAAKEATAAAWTLSWRLASRLSIGKRNKSLL